MFSGKTTELIARLSAAAAPAIALKPARDDRYAQSELVSHAGQRHPATPIGSANDIRAAASEYTVVGIDEAHFFGNNLVAPVLALVESGARVIVCGVERDHRGRPFEPFPTLLCEADHVLKMSGPCALCVRPAVHSQRLTSSDAPIVVGGAEMYQARCRACFKPL
jgi:thymidine kinase